MKLPPILFVAVVVFLSACGRTGDFQAQARAGQPIVRAIEEYREQTGNYPASLTNLVPNYLSAVPGTADLSSYKLAGWIYRTVTNGSLVSYNLRYYMGRGKVEYEPPNWIGNDESYRTVILSHE
jgi:hypothetical protein